MKHILIFSTFFLVFGSFAFAQEQSKDLPNLPQRRDEIKQHIEEKKIELQSQIQEKQQEVQNQIQSTQTIQKTKLQILAQERVSKIIFHIFEQFEAVLVKFDGIIIRIETRITKLNEQGISTTDTELLLAQAKTQMQDSTALISASKIELEKAISTEISKEEIKHTIEICKTSLKNTQTALITVITSIKNLDGIEENIILE